MNIFLIYFLFLLKAYGFESHPNKINTRLIHAGTELTNGEVNLPISLSTTYKQTIPGKKTRQNDINSHNKGFFYSRMGNPNRGSLERILADLENGKYCAVFSSGMASIAAVFNLLESKDHIISGNDLYGGTFTLMNNNKRIDVSYSEMSKVKDIEKLIRPNTKMIYIECPTNPTLKTSDIKGIANLCKKHNLMLVVDNTFLGPYLQTPINLGADIVINSMTKSLAGHSDVIMGGLVTSNETLYNKLVDIQYQQGGVPSPFDCYLCTRGIKTLGVRMERYQENANKIAKFLNTHPKVEKVLYPGLPQYTNKDIFEKQSKGSGGIVSFYLKGDKKTSKKFLKNLKIFSLAVSLGSVESLACCPALMTHTGIPEKHRNKIGVKDNLIRLSCGLEDYQDLILDLENAFSEI